MFSIIKSTVECYKIRSKENSTWADIVIDSKENSTNGRIQIVSDYGDYQYYWSACGMPFKKFLIELEKGYFASKVGADKYFDNAATLTSYKIDILHERRKDNIDNEFARKAFEEIKELKDLNKDEFCYYLNKANFLMSFYNYCPEFFYTFDPCFEIFWRKLWPIFINTLKEELNN